MKNSLTLFLLIMMVSCMDEPAPVENIQVEIPPTQEETKESLKPITKGYYILEEYRDESGFKSQFEIGIESRISKDSLVKLSSVIKEELDLNCKHNFVRYYIGRFPTIGSDYYAQATLNDEIQVHLAGMSAEELATSKKTAEKNKVIIGKWMDNSPYSGGLMTIFNKNNRIYLEKIEDNGYVQTDELIEADNDDRYEYKSGDNADAGTYYLIRGNRLKCYDSEGFIFSANSVD